ncbi:MAG TPA: hypothetical protein VFT49_02120 [Candidatus Saccharimonadales bacterium]|nr:hypothetical protein [Candidatus Saccharimonadales bacterium]
MNTSRHTISNQPELVSMFLRHQNLSNNDQKPRRRPYYYAAFLLAVLAGLTAGGLNAFSGAEPPPTSNGSNANSPADIQPMAASEITSQTPATNIESDVSTSSNSQGGASGSVSVNGQTYSVSGNGQLNKNIKSDNTNTQLNISVHSDDSGGSSSSSVHVESNTTTEGL